MLTFWQSSSTSGWKQLVGLLIFWLLTPLLARLGNYIVAAVKRRRRRRSRTGDSSSTPTDTTALLPAPQGGETALNHEFISAPFYLAYATTSLNGLFQRIVDFAPRFWKCWFEVGVWAALLALASGCLLLVMEVWSFFDLFEGGNDVSLKEWSPILIPIIPGVTFPLNQLPYLLCVILLAGIVHESGHALAGLAERVSLSRSGWFLFIIYPGAFVEFEKDELEEAAPKSRLRIASAGVWHNFGLAMFSAFILYAHVLNPIWQVIGYEKIDYGVVVADVATESPLASYLTPGQIINRINDQRLIHLNDSSDFVRIIAKQSGSKRRIGYCNYVVKTNLECCKISSSFPLGQDPDPSVFCFQERDTDDSPMRYCLNVKSVLALNRERCEDSTDCRNGEVCLVPNDVEPKGRITVLGYIEKGQELQLIHLGWPIKIIQDVKTTLFLSYKLPLSLPLIIETLISYLLWFNLAFAVLNAVPVSYLDGEHILAAWIQRLAPQSLIAGFLQHVIIFLSNTVMLISVILGFAWFWM